MPYSTNDNYWPPLVAGTQMGNQWGVQNPGMAFYAHMRRDINLIICKDNQVISFVNEMLPKPASAPFTIYNPSSSSSMMFSSTYQPYTTERILLWGRMSNSVLVAGMRWVPWYRGERGSPEDTKVYPFREIFCPTMTYDVDANVIHLWFWTNAINVAWNTKYRDIWDGKQVFIGTDWDSQYRILERLDASKILCYATGEFVSTKVSGGLVLYDSAIQIGLEAEQNIHGQLGTQGFAVSDYAYDMVPLFSEPKIISLDYSNQGDVNGNVYGQKNSGNQGMYGMQGLQRSGLITDGMPLFRDKPEWRGVTGMQRDDGSVIDGIQQVYCPWNKTFPVSITDNSDSVHGKFGVQIFDNGLHAMPTRSGTIFLPDGVQTYMPVGFQTIGMQCNLI